MLGFGKSRAMPAPDDALPGRTERMPVPRRHAVLNVALEPPYPEGCGEVLFGMGCFWGAERIFWETAGVHVTAVGYAGGYTPNPTYEEVCSGRTGHTEVVRVVFDPRRVGLDALLARFWEGHDPTQHMRQGNDVGSQYRSFIGLFDPAQRPVAEASRAAYQQALHAAGLGDIRTELSDRPAFYFAEGYHQQYLAKNPGGYCGHGGTGVACPTGLPA